MITSMHSQRRRHTIVPAYSLRSLATLLSILVVAGCAVVRPVVDKEPAKNTASVEITNDSGDIGKLLVNGVVLDVVSAQMELFNSELEQQRTLADALKALAEIEMLTSPAQLENQQ